MKSLYLFISLCFISILSWGQTIINPGDLVILGINSNVAGNTVDEISFACFKDITTGTTFEITDMGYERCYAGLWGSGEGGAILTRTGGTIPAGTIITFRTAQSSAPYIVFTYPDAAWAVADLGSNCQSEWFNLNDGGDQVYFAQNGTWTAGATCSNTFPGAGGRMLFAFSTSGGWVALGNSTKESALYPGMSCYSMAPTTASNWVMYDGPMTAATQKDWISRINSTANWKNFATTTLYLTAAASELYGKSIPIIPGTDADWTPNPDTLCQSSPTIDLNSLITGLGLPGGTWSGTGVVAPGDSIFNPAGLSGTYNITYTNDCPCCISQTHTITVNSSPVVIAGSNTPICSGNNLNLTSSGTGTYNWSGPNSFSSSIQNPTITGITTAGSGTYLVTVTSASGCVSTASTSVIITQSPTANAGPDITIPNGTDATLNCAVTGGTGPFTYNWSPSDSLMSSNVQNPTTIILSGTTAYTVTVTDQTTGCTSTDQIIVNISGGPLHVNSLTVTPSSICKGDSTQIQATATGGSGSYTYTWSPSAGLNSTSISNPIANPTDTTTYIVSVNDGFTIVTSQVTIIVYPLPIVNASSNSPVCSGNTLNFTSSGGSVYNWSGPGSFSNSNQDPSIMNALPTSSGNYIVTVTDSNGCSATAQTAVVINANPTATASSNTPCEGQTINLSSGGGSIFNWSGPNGFSDSIQFPTIPNADTAITAGTYTVTVTDGNGCSLTAQTIVAVNSNPLATASSNTPCEGQTLNLICSGNPSNSYNWSGPDGFSNSNQNTTVTNADTSLNAGTYTVTVTDGNGCSSTSQTIVAVNSNPLATASGNTPCAGLSLNLISDGGSTYNWSGPNSFSSSTQNPTISGVILSDAGTYIVTVTNGNGCSSTAQTLITINPNPAATASSNTPCDGQTLNLSSGGGATYNWAGPNSFSSSSQNPSISGIILSDVGTYIVTVTDGNGCSSTAQTSVVINNNPTAIASGNTPCEGHSLNLTSGGGATYNWAGPNSFTSSSQNPSISGVISSDAGTYTVTVTDVNGCTAIAQAIISINANPTATGSRNTPCEGQTLNLTSGGGSTYNWAGPNSFSSSVQNPSVSVATMLAAGTYTVTVTNTQGCTGTDNVLVNINALPVVSLHIPENDYCIDASPVTLAGSPVGGSFSGIGVINDSIFNPSLAGIGQYELVYSYTDSNSCSSSDSALILVTPVPTVTVQGGSDPTIQIYTGEVVTVTASPVNYQNYSFYIGGKLVQSGASNIYQSNTFVNGNTTVVIYASEGGCIATDSVILNVIPIPNGCIPGDSEAENQIFLKGLDIQIFNRWDQLLYSGTDGWNGEYKGKLVSPGTYFYIATLTNLDKSTTTLKGPVTVVDPR